MVEETKKQYGRLLSLALLLAMAVCLFNMLTPEEVTAKTSGNLLINPGAETGKLTGWTDPSKEKCWMIGYKGDINGWSHPSPYSGSYYFMTGWPSEEEVERVLYQDVNIPVYDGGMVTFEGYLGGYGHDDEGGIRLELLNSSGNVISTMSSDMYKLNFGNWMYVSVSLKTTTEAVTARASLVGVLNQGDEADAYFDDLSLTVSDGRNDDPANLAQVKNFKATNKKVKQIYISYKNVYKAVGYQIRIATNKKMKKARKLFTKETHGYLNNKTVKGNIFKKGKTYYIQVRAYRYEGNKKVYGKWSVKKKVKMSK